MNGMIRWAMAWVLVAVMTAGLCAASYSHAEAAMVKQPVPYSQEEKKPEPDKKPASGEEDEGCKC